jgi:hypothetical protein
VRVINERRPQIEAILGTLAGRHRAREPAAGVISSPRQRA